MDRLLTNDFKRDALIKIVIDFRSFYTKRLRTCAVTNGWFQTYSYMIWACNEIIRCITCVLADCEDPSDLMDLIIDRFSKGATCETKYKVNMFNIAEDVAKDISDEYEKFIRENGIH